MPSEDGPAAITAEQAGEARLKAAIQLLGEAERTINRAAQALCSIAYMGKDWTAVGEVADKAREARYRIHASAAKLRHAGKGIRHTDDEPELRYEAEWLGSSP